MVEFDVNITEPAEKEKFVDVDRILYGRRDWKYILSSTAKDE